MKGLYVALFGALSCRFAPVACSFEPIGKQADRITCTRIEPDDSLGLDTANCPSTLQVE